MSDEWTQPDAPPAPLFTGKKERDLVKKVNDELIEKIIGQQVLYYPIDIENTNLNWKNYVNFSISDSLIYINDNQLILDGKLIINLIQPNEIYKFLLTPKNYRADIKKVEFNFNYSFDQKIMILNDIKINGKKNQNVSNILKKLLFKEVEIQNKIYFKNLMNNLLLIIFNIFQKFIGKFCN